MLSKSLVFRHIHTNTHVHEHIVWSVLDMDYLIFFIDNYHEKKIIVHLYNFNNTEYEFFFFFCITKITNDRK